MLLAYLKYKGLYLLGTYSFIADMSWNRRSDMTLPLLQLKALGIDNIMKFEWVSAPSSEAVIRALERLVRSGMIGEDARLTEVGAKVAELGVDIGIASMLWKSKEMKCSEEVLTIAAMVSVQVLVCLTPFVLVLIQYVQDVFIIPDGAAGALAELERRKFTAEEGVSFDFLWPYGSLMSHYQDHLTLLNGSFGRLAYKGGFSFVASL